MSNELKVKNGLIVQGNEQITGSLFVSQGITSSLGLFGTSSWANNSISASFASTVITASYATNAGTAATASFVTTAQTASYITSSNIFGTIISSSFSVNSGQASSASFASTVVTASFATNAGNASTANTATTATTASFATNAGTSATSSFITFAQTASYVFATGSILPITASWAGTASVLIGSVTSASFSTNAYTASSLTNWSFDNTSSTSIVTASNNIVVSRVTSSFLSVDYQYVINSGSNLRAGNIFGGWLPNGSQVTYAEYVTTDIGTTDQVSMSIALTGSLVQLLSNAANSFSWSIRAIATYL